MSAAQTHRLDGLEPDNPLAFLALLGMLRALKAEDHELHPRISWTFDAPPLRPRIHLSRILVAGELAASVAQGLDALAEHHAFEGRKDLNHTGQECRALLEQAARSASVQGRERADLLAALMSDAALKDGKDPVIDPTPMCLLFGQGHQHFLERLSLVPRLTMPPPRGRGRQAVQISPGDCIAEALFQPWHREDGTPSFRWDPMEDVRYATMAGDPTDAAYKTKTQHGANRLAAVGLAALALAPQPRAGRVRPSLIGGAQDAHGFTFAWPVWREPATLSAILALLSHPGLRTAGALRDLGIDQVMVAKRISVGKFMNFTRARPVTSPPTPSPS